MQFLLYSWSWHVVKEVKGIMDSSLVRIPPVYSEYHPDAQAGSVRLLKHQVETWKAFRDPAIDVLFNASLTGDGKNRAESLDNPIKIGGTI